MKMRVLAWRLGVEKGQVGPRGKVDEAGLSVPEDVYVVGYDNTYLADRALVSLTSRDMSVLAARVLLERVESGPTEPRREVLTPRLIRHSTSAAH